MSQNWLDAIDPGAVLPIWVPKQLTQYPRKLIQTRIGWLRSLAERDAPPLTNWELIPAFAAQKDLRKKVHDRKLLKRKAFKTLQSAKIKQARTEAVEAPIINENGLAQTVTLTLDQMLVFGNRFSKVKGVKAPHEQQPSDDQILRTVLDGMNVVILDVGAPDQVVEDVSNERVEVGENHGQGSFSCC